MGFPYFGLFLPIYFTMGGNDSRYDVFGFTTMQLGIPLFLFLFLDLKDIKPEYLPTFISILRAWIGLAWVVFEANELNA